ncbi:MAG TPA: adenylate/guanylate cyclase domain-containing protein [Burkholderiales bacterium]|nr:adenylate/guanylate cyclase domain-containing protein [Burkholderiales bacterium]
MNNLPETRYVRSEGVHIAYQVLGGGPIDVVFVPGFVSNVEANWQSPDHVRFFHRLASFCRLILFDKRGTGMSDRSSELFSLERRMEDVHAIMDEVGSERAALFGVSEGGPMSLLFAASYPGRTSALVLYGSYARRSWAPDYPFGWKDDKWASVLDKMEHHWGTPQAIDLSAWAPSIANSEDRAWRSAAYLRNSASPGAALAVMRMNREIDVRHVLPAIRVPTLVLHRTGDRFIGVENARYMARRIPGATLVELPGIDHTPWIGDVEAMLSEVELFLTGQRAGAPPDRVLATVLFTDIAQSTERAAALGDRGWRELLEGYQLRMREELARWRGREIDTAGDGFLIAFDGPARAIQCASRMREAARGLGLDIRAGLHTGECEVMDGKLGGIAVHTGARVAALAAAGEVLVSQTVKDLVAGSGLRFAERGTHTLKGVPGEWRLYAVVA